VGSLLGSLLACAVVFAVVFTDGFAVGAFECCVGVAADDDTLEG
jgi:hypothetical protein